MKVSIVTEAYRLAHPREAYLISKTAAHGHWSSQGVMFCIIRNVDMILSDVHGRWLCPHEIILLQGFPVSANLQFETSFSRRREDFEFPPRTRASTCHQAGNAMHPNMVGAAVIYALAFVVQHDKTASQRFLARNASNGGDSEAGGRRGKRARH